MQKVSIVIPAHNEEKRIPPTLREYLRFFLELKRKKILDFEIIVVLNACKDNTRKVVEGYSTHKELKILEFVQGGKGFAVVEGFKEALKSDSEIIGYVDADMSTPPESFYDLVKNTKDADGAIANRWDKRSVIKTKQTFFRHLMSMVFNFTARSLFFFTHRDTQCGAKVFKRELIQKVYPKLGSSEWSFDVDLLFYMRREGAKIKSVPTTWEDKKESNINLKRTPLKMLASVIRLRLVHSPFKFIVRAHSKFPESIKVPSLLDRIN